MKKILIEGPYFEDLSKGQIMPAAPAVTLTEGHAMAHQMLFGDRLRLSLDRHLSAEITGSDRPLVNPSITFGVAVGQTTYVTQHVMGNLFYRGLVLKQPVYVGDTLSTETKVVALRQNKSKPGRLATGMVVLEMHVLNQQGDEILHFWRCPMVPCRNQDADTGHADDFDKIPTEIDQTLLRQAVPDNWDLERFRHKIKGEHFADVEEGVTFQIEARDTVTCAPELARLILNMAMTHTDAGASVYGKRLVYGGHTVSIAAAQMLRALPNIVTLLAWQHCDHVAPVFENDILRSEVFVEKKTRLETGGGLVDLKIKVWAERGENAPQPDKDVLVLDWGLIVLMA